VPVRNGEKTIGDCVAALLATDYPLERREIVVVDNGSTDGTAELLRPLPVRVVREDRVGRSHARNRGVAESRGEIVAFTDADCIADGRWLTELVGAFRRDTSAVAGEVLAECPQTRAQRFMAQRHPGWQKVVLDLAEPFALTANVAFRRQVFATLGLFDPGFVTAEDVDFGWRFFAAGLAMTYCPQATVSHRLRSTPWRLVRQQEGLGYGRELLRERYDLPRDYAIPTWTEVKKAAADLFARSGGEKGRPRYAGYELLVTCALRAGALRRRLESGLRRARPGSRLVGPAPGATS
jgi:glycosyltransferase involved in cell wall biosynthesis